MSNHDKVGEFIPGLDSKPLYQVEPIYERDIEPMTPILETWVRNRLTGETIPEEIASIKERMRKSLESSEYKYFIVRDEIGKPLGMVGCREPDEMTSWAAITEDPLEVVNFFVSRDARGKGIGTKLLEAVRNFAINNNNTEILINSGPRYKESAWSFYSAKLGDPVGIIRFAYDFKNRAKSFEGGATIDQIMIEGGDAPVWRMLLV